MWYRINGLFVIIIHTIGVGTGEGGAALGARIKNTKKQKKKNVTKSHGFCFYLLYADTVPLNVFQCGTELMDSL